MTVVSPSVRFFFFFQAEDGIRALYVTGVQTCALPICDDCRCDPVADHGGGRSQLRTGPAGLEPRSDDGLRSEERRVGKECRSRWSTSHLKKKRYSKSNTYTTTSICGV